MSQYQKVKQKTIIDKLEQVNNNRDKSNRRNKNNQIKGAKTSNIRKSESIIPTGTTQEQINFKNEDADT